MVAYLDSFLEALPNDASVTQMQTELQALAARNREESANETQHFSGQYARMLDKVETLHFPPSFEATDIPLITTALAYPGQRAIPEMLQWWINRAAEIGNDLSAINEKTGNSYLIDIFNILKVGPEDPKEFLPVVAQLVINYYLRYSLFTRISTEITAADPAGIMAGAAFNEREHPDRWPIAIVNLLAESTILVSQETAANVLKSAGTADLNKKLKAGFSEYDKSLGRFPNEASISPGIALLVNWTHQLDRSVRENPELLSAEISDYLFSENEKGESLIHLLMQELLGVENDSKQYDEYQQNFFKSIFHVILQDVFPDIKESALDELFYTEVVRQAAISGEELTELMKYFNDFSAELDNITVPSNAPDSIPVYRMRDDFNGNSQAAIEGIYTGTRRRLSLAEKTQLKNELVDYAYTAANNVNQNGLVLSPRISDIFSHFASTMAQRVSAVFSTSIKKAPSPSGSTSSHSSSSTAASASTSSVASSAPLSAAAEYVSQAAGRFKRGLETSFAPSTPKAPKLPSPRSSPR